MSDAFALRLRETVRAALPEGAFLRRDRGDALFITDGPRRGKSPDWAALGFLCEEKNGLARLTPGAAWLQALEAEYPEPPDHLSARFRCFGGPPDERTFKLFAMGLKMLDGDPFDPAFDRKLRQLAAVALREHKPCGGLYACALLRYRIYERSDSNEA